MTPEQIQGLWVCLTITLSIVAISLAVFWVLQGEAHWKMG
jgi:cytochrome bd-type quinol oxidase subunit 1